MAESQLLKLKEENKELPRQGSDEWRKLREDSIGGSEIASLLGINPFKSAKQLVKDKAGIGFSFTGNTATRWGKLFEYVTREIVKLICVNNIIHEFSSLAGCIDGHRFSPDGLMQLINGIILLLEFKSPLNSIPDGKIPKYYLPQVKMGLSNIPFAKRGLFVNNMFRICSKPEMKIAGAYNTRFHASDVKKMYIPDAELARGYIMFYVSSECAKEITRLSREGIPGHRVIKKEYEMDNSDGEEFTLIGNLAAYINDGGSLLDFGDYDDIADLLLLFESDLIHGRFSSFDIEDDKFYSHLEYTRKKSEFDGSHKKCDGVFYGNSTNISDAKKVGFLCWKMFRSDMIEVEREHDYHEKVKPHIDKALDNIKKIKSISSLSEKLAFVEEMYPRKR